MGWKNVKEHYQIKHIVHVEKEGICIGSQYINDIIVIDFNGKIIRRYDDGGNADLSRYQREMDEDPETLRRLIETPDVFSQSIEVYTYEGSKILNKFCETPGWPNVTHDGELMYENLFSTDRQKIIEAAKYDIMLGLKHTQQDIARAENDLLALRALLENYQRDQVEIESLSGAND